MSVKKAKLEKPKYAVGVWVRDSEGNEGQVVLINCTLDEWNRSIHVTYTCLTKDGVEVIFTSDQKLKKFTLKLTEREKAVKATQESRKNFEVKPAKERLHTWIESPNEENLKEMLSSPEIGFDIETLGIESYGIKTDSGLKMADGLVPERGLIRLIQVYLPLYQKCIVWDLGTLADRGDVPDIQKFGIRELRKVLASRGVKKYIHNAAFESKWIAHHLKCPILNVVDSMILSQLYWAGTIKGFHAIGIKSPNSLQQVCLRVLGITPDKENQAFDYAMPVNADQLNYAALDAKLTIEVGQKLMQMCLDAGMQKVVEAEMMAIPAFAQMNYKGMPADRKELERLLVHYKGIEAKAIEPWMELFPDSNPGSWMQVLDCLKEKWGLVPLKKDTKTGEEKPGTDNATLTPYALDNPVIEALLLWRSIKKLREYIQGYLQALTTVNGRTVIRANYRQNAAQVTGRSSSGGDKNQEYDDIKLAVNLQNIPAKISDKKEKLGCEPLRTAFIASFNPNKLEVDFTFGLAKLFRCKRFMSPTFRLKFLTNLSNSLLETLLLLSSCLLDVLIVVDLAASHAQIARYLSQDAALLLSNQPGNPKLHFYTVRGLMELEGVKATPKELKKAKNNKKHPLYGYVKKYYNPAKTVFYSGLNVGGATRLQQTFLKDFDTLYPLDVCKSFVEGGKKAYPGLVKFQFNTKTLANSQGRDKTFEVETPSGKVKKIGGFTKHFATVKSIDGGRLYIEKKPNSFAKGKPEAGISDIVSYCWLRPEATIIKKSLGMINDYILDNHIQGWICQMTHDEIGVNVREDQAYKMAEYMVNQITANFQELIPDYTPEDTNPSNFIAKSWHDAK